MPFDAHQNFAISAVATAPSPATSGTSLVVSSGHGTRFPAVPFNATIWPASSTPDPTNAEIVRVTAISTDTLTITRAQESSSARTVIVGDQIMAGVTALTLTDVENATKTWGLLVPVMNNPPAANYATADTRNSRLLYNFDTTTEESMLFLGRIPKGAALGSGIKFTIMWTAATATSGATRWGIQVERGTTDIDSDSFDTAGEATTTTSGTSGVPNLTDITLTTIDSAVAEDFIFVKVYRDTSDGADTMAGDAQILGIAYGSAA